MQTLRRTLLQCHLYEVQEQAKLNYGDVIQSRGKISLKVTAAHVRARTHTWTHTHTMSTSSPLEPVNVNFFGKRVFTYVIKALEMRFILDYPTGLYIQ